MEFGFFERVGPKLYRLTPYGQSVAAGEIDLDRATRTIRSRVSSTPSDLEQLQDQHVKPLGTTQTTSRRSSAVDAGIKNMGRQRERSKRSNVSLRSIPGTRSLQGVSASCDGNRPRTCPLQADWFPMKWTIAFASPPLADSRSDSRRPDPAPAKPTSPPPLGSAPASPASASQFATATQWVAPR